MDVQKTVDNVTKLLHQIEGMAKAQVLVGVPASKTARKLGGTIGNADLAYIHDNGSPAHGIPARPFLKQGIAKSRDEVNVVLRQGAVDILHGRGGLEGILNKAGMIARNKVVEEITDPAPAFDALKAATVRARLRRTAAGRRQLRTIKNSIKGSQTMKDAISEWAAGGNAKPLIDTGQLRAAITYVVKL